MFPSKLQVCHMPPTSAATLSYSETILLRTHPPPHSPRTGFVVGRHFSSWQKQHTGRKFLISLRCVSLTYGQEHIVLVIDWSQCSSPTARHVWSMLLEFPLFFRASTTVCHYQHISMLETPSARQGQRWLHALFSSRWNATLFAGSYWLEAG